MCGKVALHVMELPLSPLMLVSSLRSVGYIVYMKVS